MEGGDMNTYLLPQVSLFWERLGLGECLGATYPRWKQDQPFHTSFNIKTITIQIAETFLFLGDYLLNVVDLNADRRGASDG